VSEKKCSNCWFDTGNHCRLGSSHCVTQVFNGEEEPSRWMSVQDGIQAELELTNIERRRTNEPIK